MGLRCKKSDLAIVLRSPRGKEGAIVHVSDFYGEGFNTVRGRHVDDLWFIEYDGVSYLACDRDMLPINPNELKEEEEKEVTA